MNCLYYKERYTERTAIKTGVMATATMQAQTVIVMCPRMGQPKTETQTHSQIRAHAWYTRKKNIQN